MNEASRSSRTADEWSAIGIGHAQQGNSIEACAAFQRAAEIDPNSAPFHYNLGIARQNLGYLEEAATSYRRALELKPDHVNALTNLGTLLVAQMQLDEAVACCRRALELTPNDAEVHNNLGAALFEQGKAEEAAACYRRALALRPDYPEANNNLGVALHRQGKFDEAIACYRRTLERNLNDPMAHNFLGAALQAQRKLDEAIACYRQALALNPDYAAAHNNLGAALFEQGDVDAAIACGRRALELMPDDAGAHSSLIFMMYYHPHYDSQAIHDECRRWNQRHAEPLRRSIRPHLNSRDPDRKLRIGYVSPDFYDHVLSCFTIPLLANHDRRQFEIYCYANVKAPDAVTEQVRRFAAVWRDTVGLSDQRLAELIREDRIDILVELTMHAENNRLLVFARKPAPVQVAWLGINGTTGLSTIDYRLTDPYLDPPGPGDAVYSEKSLRLPDTFWCYRPLIDPPAVNPLPFDQNGYWTFGCLNNFVKVNDGTLELWAKVLRAVPGSRLLLLAPQGQARNRVSAKLKHEGIAEDRLEFCERTTRPGYFQLYSKIDFCLDTTPYNSHTTSLDAFTMGVPTVTLIGRTVVGREGWSQLRNLGLGELAATTAEQFVEIAISLANDPPRLRRLRETLRPRMIASPLMDADRFARNIEQAFREMWRAWEKEPRTE